MFSRQATNLRVSAGRLAPCPASPNCVCTQPGDDRHRAAPIPWTGNAPDAIELLVKIINAWPRTRIVTRQEKYLHAEFVTPLLRFVDDVEFFVDEGAGLIQFRSASRVGHSDLGVNRRRMERILREFNRVTA